jgi:hypothetical protein
MSARQRLKILDRGFSLPRFAAHRGKLDAEVKGAPIFTPWLFCSGTKT